MMRQPERNAEVIRLHKSGQGPTAIAREFSITPVRVREIVGRAAHREKWRTELIEQYGEHPEISALPDETPIDVLALCPGNLHGWETRVRHLAWMPPTPVPTLGDLRKASATKLRKKSIVGAKFLSELRRFCPGNELAEHSRARSLREPTVRLKTYLDTTADACVALRMIRKVIEANAPPGSVPSEERVAPPFVREAEALVKGVLAIARAPRRRTR